MLENLTQRLTRVVKTMRGEARLTESNTQAMLREVRMALLEADVALPVVRAFIERVKEKALGQDVANSLNPGQALVGVVHRELTALMGGDLGEGAGELSLAAQPPAVILMAGLDLPLSVVREHIAASVDLVVQQARLSSGRRLIVAICEITGMESGRIQMQELFRYRPGNPSAFCGCGVLPERCVIPALDPVQAMAWFSQCTPWPNIADTADEHPTGISDQAP